MSDANPTDVLNVADETLVAVTEEGDDGEILVDGHNIFNEDLISKYGDPVRRVAGKGGNKIAGVYESYWAADHASRALVIYEPHESRFYQYDSATGMFSPVTEDSVKQAISARLLEVSRMHDDLRDLANFRDNRHLRNYVAQLKGIAGQTFEPYGQNYCHFKNKMVVFDDAWFHPEDFSPKFKSRNQIPVDFDAGATCPRFLNELIGPALDAEGQSLLQKLMGQMMIGRNLAQRILVLDGEAGRGKTQLVNLMMMLVGRFNVTQLRTAQLCNRFEVGRYAGLTLLIGSDVPDDFLLKPGAAVLKSLVGGDMLEGELKGSNSKLPLRGDFNVVITSNSQLKVATQSDEGAWRRRLVVLRFASPPPKKIIPNFAEELFKAEGPGIVTWCMKGAVHLLSDIRRGNGLHVPPGIMSRTDALLGTSGTLRGFVEKHLQKSQGGQITSEEISTAFAAYCRHENFTEMSRSRVLAMLPSLMSDVHGVTRSNDLESGWGVQRGYRNVVLVGTR